MQRNYLLFLSAYVAVYGGLHLFVYFRLRSAVGPGWRWTLLFFLLSLAMVAGSHLLWVLDLGEMPRLHKVLACMGYTWMAFIFLVFSIYLVFDVLRIVLWIVDSLFSSGFGGLLASPGLRSTLAVGGALIICIMGWYGAQNIQTVHLTLATSKLPGGIERVRIAQLSDIHLGWVVQEERLSAMLDAVKAAEPDMLVITGDLVDGDMKLFEAEAELFRQLGLPLGTFAITGNHEYYAGVDQALAFMKSAGMRVLRNEALRVGGIVLAGVDDRTAARFGYALRPEEEILKNLPASRYVVLLKHQPTIDPSSVGLFDLQLSGHTHGGQIWPFYWATRMIYAYSSGLRAVVPSGETGQAFAGARRESKIYVNQGAGTWGPPIRFLTPPEVENTAILSHPRGVLEPMART